MVADEENRASNINEDEEQDVSYPQAAQGVFSSSFVIIREVEWTQRRKIRMVADEVSEETLLIDGIKGSDGPLDALLTKSSLQPCP